MPRVPVYERQVLPQPAPMVRYDTDTATATVQGGMALAAGARRIADVGAKIAADQQDTADAERVTAAISELSSLELDLLRGEKGFFNRKGESARGLGIEADAAWTEGLKKIRSGLASPRQIQAFDRAASGHTASFRKSVLTHEDSEMNAVDANNTNAAIGNNIERAGQATDDQSFQDAVGEAIRVSDAYLGRTSQGKEVVESARRAITSDAYKSRAEGIARTSPVDALKFVEANRDKYTTEAYDSLVGKLQRDSDDVRVSDLTDEIVAASSPGGDFSYAEAQRIAAEKLKGNPLRSKVEDALAVHHTRVKAIDTEAKANALQEAMAQTLRGGIDPAWMRSLPDHIELEIRDWQRTYNKQRQAEWEDSNTYKTGQAIIWAEFVDEASQPGANVQELIVKYAKRGLDPDKLMEAPSLARRGSGSQGTKFTELFSDEANIKMWLVEAGVVQPNAATKDWTKDQVLTQVFLSQRLQEFVTANEALGIKPTPKDKKDFAMGLLAPILFRRKASFSLTGRDEVHQRSAATISGEDRKRAFVPMAEASVRERSAAFAILRKRGVKPTTTQVEEMIWDMKTGDDTEAFMEYRLPYVDAVIRAQGKEVTDENRRKTASWMIQVGWTPESER